MGRASLPQEDNPWWTERHINNTLVSNHIFGARQVRRPRNLKQDTVTKHLLDVQEARPTS